MKNHIEAFPTWIEFELNVYEADDYDDVYLNYVDIYPAGEDQALQISFHPDDTDQVLVDNDYVTIIYSLDVENTLESFYDYSIPLVVVNKTETPLLLNAGTGVLNSSETDILYADTIAPYCMKYSTVGWSAEDLTKASISSTDVKTITLTMRFLADHLNGDKYFRIHRPGQNLDRARTQFALLADMEKHQEEMRAMLTGIYRD